MYRNRFYTECTTIDNNGIKWCATTASWDADETWGACVCDLTSGEFLSFIRITNIHKGHNKKM